MFSLLPLSAIRQPAFLYGSDDTIRGANDLAEALAGRPLAGLSAADVIGVFDIRSADRTPLAPTDLPASRALGGEEAVDVPFMITAADGRTVQIRVTAAPLRDGTEIVGALSIWQDVTERKRAEEALRESEAKCRRFFDEDITADYISTPDGRLLDCNPAFVRMFGFASVEEAQSAGVLELYDAPGDRETLLDRLRRERRLENDERFRRRRDGSKIHVVEKIIGDFDGAGNLVQIRGYVSDDTQRHRAEEALREREQTLQGIFRAAPIGIGMVSNRVITMANDRLCRMTGYAREELIGQDARMLYPSEEAYTYVGQEKYARILASGAGAVETQWRMRNGAVLDILLSSSPADLARPHDDVIFAALDITRLRESEHALAAYTERLKRSNEELQRFAYVASHDLQEPLRSIVSFSQLLERRYKGQLDEDADEYIEFIVNGGNRMQRLIRDLLQVSRIETQAKPLKPTDAAAVMASVLRVMETRLAEAGATVEVGDLPAVMADEAQLVQVFANLIGNAAKYGREDVTPTVRIEGWRVGPMVEISVSDNGIGIEAEYFDRIFEMFRRLHTHDEYEGTGIGLAVVKKIVERHGGRIRVESTPGEGSTFFFTLPAA